MLTRFFSYVFKRLDPRIFRLPYYGFLKLLAKSHFPPFLWLNRKIVTLHTRVREKCAADLRRAVQAGIHTRKSLGDQMFGTYDKPDFVVVPSRAAYVNIVTPGFDLGVASAGVFGYLQYGAFLRKLGIRVRVIFYNYYNCLDRHLHENKDKYPNLREAMELLEFENITYSFKAKLSPHDICIANAWMTAYCAKKFQEGCNPDYPFIYFIQDYETRFYPDSSCSLATEATYSLNYKPMISTQPLADFLFTRRIGRFANIDPTKDRGKDYAVFNNAFSAPLPDEESMRKRVINNTLKVAFYSRPTVDRNAFAVGALALIEAYQEGIFANYNVEFYGIGMGVDVIQLDSATNKMVNQLPRMTILEYEKTIQEFDICLSLMISPHPSITPIDLAAVGALVVTNSYATKNAQYFAGISSNILCVEPTVQEIKNGLREAVKRSANVPERLEGAKIKQFTRNWDEVWSEEHVRFVKENFPPEVWENYSASGAAKKSGEGESESAVQTDIAKVRKTA